MQVRWDDVGRTTEPGEYPVGGETVVVTLNELEIWKRYPDAVFDTSVHVRSFTDFHPHRMLTTWSSPSFIDQSSGTAP